MLATVEQYRGRGIATKLVCMAIDAMKDRGADEVRQLVTLTIVYADRNQIVLETEVTNAGSLRLYERLGFIRSKRLHRYYLNGNTAFRLILYLKEGTGLKVPQHQDCYSDIDPPLENPRPAPPP